jgi:hypothetical protein
MKYSLMSRVDADGVVRFALELGKEYANKFVRVTVEGVGIASGEMTHEEWLRFIEDTAGKWEGELERPPQGEYEEREPL